MLHSFVVSGAISNHSSGSLVFGIPKTKENSQNISNSGKVFHQTQNGTKGGQGFCFFQQAVVKHTVCKILTEQINFILHKREHKDVVLASCPDG